ncbi:MAG: hypothetical protein ACLUKN_03775 [Bacilli bacterium]
MRFCANIRDTYWNKILMKVIDSKILDSGFEEFGQLEFLNRNLADMAVRNLSKSTAKNIFTTIP